MLLDMGISNDFFFLESDTKSKNRKRRNKQVGPHKIQKLMHIQGNHQ